MTKSQDTIEQIGHHKLRRRGFFAGVAALSAAALLKVTGADKAQAADGLNVVIGGQNTGSNTTYLIANNATGGSFGAYNQTAAGISVTRAGSGLTGRVSRVGAVGVEGINELLGGGNNGVGVMGEGPPTGTGVLGWAGTILSSPPPGAAAVSVFGGAQSARTAVKGEATNGYGVWGATNQAAGVLGTTAGAYGVQGHASTTGTGGVFTSASGIGARAASDTFVGLLGLSGSNIGVYASTASGSLPALYAENTTGGRAAQFIGGVEVHGSFAVIGGPKAALVPTRDGSLGMMYCQEAPEPYFEDFGRAQLTGGVAHVPIETEFSFLIHRDAYMVFLTPLGDCRGLYVSRQDQNGFEVRELSGGLSNVPFTYRIVARRRDISGGRLARQGLAGSAAATVKPAFQDIRVPVGPYGPTFNENPLEGSAQPVPPLTQPAPSQPPNTVPQPAVPADSPQAPQDGGLRNR